MSADLHSEVITVITPPRTVQPCTAAQLAAEAGVSRRMIFLGLKVRRAGCEEMHRMIRDGSLSMNLAAVLVDLFPSHDDQRVVLAEFATLRPREWLGFARRVAALMNGENPRVTEPEPMGSGHRTALKPGSSANRLPSCADSNCHEGEAS